MARHPIVTAWLEGRSADVQKISDRASPSDPLCAYLKALAATEMSRRQQNQPPRPQLEILRSMIGLLEAPPPDRDLHRALVGQMPALCARVNRIPEMRRFLRLLEGLVTGASSEWTALHLFIQSTCATLLG